MSNATLPLDSSTTARPSTPAVTRVTLDGNEAAALVAYALSEVIAIYPITPSSTMGELADQWASQNQPNLWGTVPTVVEMQSEGGAAGALHGALQAGALATTFTASQGLLLMLPNMYKIAGELTPAVFHVAARTVATHALSIFGDHSDVYAVRQTGFSLLCSGSVQEAHDLALIAHAATLETRIPLLHFFDGFRTSHEVAKITELPETTIRAMIDPALIENHRRRALTPDRPVMRGTAHNPDTYFQAREAVNPFYNAAPGIIADVMDRFTKLTGRAYHLFDYVGHPEAEHVMVMMGSGAEAAEETVEWMVQRGERVGLLKVRLFRPWSADNFVRALPSTVRRLAVLDRSKEPGSAGEALYLDVIVSLTEAWARHHAGVAQPSVIGGRYGLSSKEFHPPRVRAVFDELQRPEPKNHFTVGINDDVTHTSLPEDPTFDPESPEVFRAIFYGLGSDGTVSANKNSIKIIGEETDLHAQGYFVYDSKKAGAITVSHLRFGPRPIHSTYLVRQAKFIGVHQWGFLDRFDVLEYAAPGGTLLLNTSVPQTEVWDALPREVQESVLEKKMRVYGIDAYGVAREAGLGRRINTIMQMAFFSLSNVLPLDQARRTIEEALRHTYARQGEEVLRRNVAAVHATLDHLYEVNVPEHVTSKRTRPPVIRAGQNGNKPPDFVERVTAMILAGKGDLLPVSAFPPDGTWPTGTARWEKRNLALEIPVWDSSLCIQCNKCTFVCPHAAIRAKIYAPNALANAPATFRGVEYRSNDLPGMLYTLQVAPEDCTGCTLCVQVCPAREKSNPRHKAINMTPQEPLRETERQCFDFFLSLPQAVSGHEGIGADGKAREIRVDVKTSQLSEPLFEFSGACLGCGETPYLKLLTQLFGDRLLIANATGCSSIYGGNLPTTPWTKNAEGRGPAWSNSLFEDNAEFGLGFRLAVDQAALEARRLLQGAAPAIGGDLVDLLLGNAQVDEAGIRRQRELVVQLRSRIFEMGTRKDPGAVNARSSGGAKDALGISLEEALGRLTILADALVKKSVWIVGGDGWAYDIGYGGLDHVLSLDRNVNVLVLDTEVYSNTGGQASKATPMAATAKFATAGKSVGKKDLGLMAMAYGHIYVAQVAFGAKDAQTVRALQEADAYDGPSLVIAYSSCIAHGYDLAESLDHQRMVSETGLWPLYRYDPQRTAAGENPLVLESKAPSVPFAKFAETETRFRVLMQTQPERARELLARAERSIHSRYELYRQMATLSAPTTPTGSASSSKTEEA